MHFCILAAELVERVVLLGAPISIKDENWEAARKVVIGTFFSSSHYCTLQIYLFIDFIFILLCPIGLYHPYYMQMVAGRFVNAYSTNDWMLGIAFRARYGQ